MEVKLSSQAFNITMLENVKSFLASVYRPILGVNPDSNVLDHFETEETDDLLKKFCFHTLNVIYIERVYREDGDEITFGHSMNEGQSLAKTIAVSKFDDGPLQFDVVVSSQLSILTIRSGSNKQKSLLSMIEYQAKHVIQPLLNVALSHSQSLKDPKEFENLVAVNKKYKEFDYSFELCKKSSLVPTAFLSLPPVLIDFCQNLAHRFPGFILDCKKLLEKYDANQVDSFFKMLDLNVICGDTQDTKEEFANELNKFAKLWPQEISKQTKFEIPSISSVPVEIDFWKDFEYKLLDTKSQLEHPVALLVKLVLRRSNRISEQLIREAEVELDKTLLTVSGSNSFLKDFPIEEIYNSNILAALISSISKCLNHFNKLKHSKKGFSLERASRLLEVFSGELLSKLQIILKEEKIIRISFHDYKSQRDDFINFFKLWNLEFANTRETLAELLRKSGIKIPDIKNSLLPLEQRLNSISEFRESHNRLLEILGEILLEGHSVLVELHEMYKLFYSSNIDVLDVSVEGSANWQRTKNLYEKRLEKLESSITKLIEEKLRNAKSTEEKFKLFSIFNPLFFRRSIWHSVNSFRTELIRYVQEDVERLQTKFTLKYDDSLEKVTTDLKDIPSLSGRILWARQIECQLRALLLRMENLLGARWEDQPDAKKIKDVCDHLLGILNVDSMVENWKSIVTTLTRDIAFGDLTVVIVKSDPLTQKHYIAVNYDPKLIQLFKEVRHLRWLVPENVLKSLEGPADDALKRYPAATSIESSLNSFRRIQKNMTPQVASLLLTVEMSVRELIQGAIVGSKVVGSKQYKKRMNWNGDGLHEWVESLSRRVLQYEEKCEDSLQKTKYVDELLLNLKTCPFKHATIESILSSIQTVVNEMQILRYSNVELWANSVDVQIEEILSVKLYSSLKSWYELFIRGGSINGVLDGQDFTLDQTVHQILLSDQILYLAPPLELACSEWIANLHQHIQIATKHKRVVFTNLNVFSESPEIKTYSSILKKIDHKVIRDSFQGIKSKVQDAIAYADKWLQYQILWDVPVATIADKVGKNISEWHQLLLGVKAARSTIDTANSEMLFGSIVVNFRQVQDKVIVKYDSWQRDLQLRFAMLIQEEMKLTYDELIGLRRQLESIELEGTTKEIVSGVEFVLKIKNLLGHKCNVVQELESSEKLLLKQRFQFSNDWLYSSNVTTAFKDLTQQLEKQLKVMDSMFTVLQSRIREEDKVLLQNVDLLCLSWEKQKPSEGNYIPGDALQIISLYLSQFEKLKEEQHRLLGAKVALGLDFVEDSRLDSLLNEVQELKDVWLSVAPIWDKIHSLKNLSFKTVVVSKLRKEIDAILSEMTMLPNKVRSYPQYEYLKSCVDRYMSYQPVLRDLTSEALKDRHWKFLLKLLNLPFSEIDFKLGHLWDASLLSFKKQINDQLAVAQGELALEQYLKQVKDFWNGLQLSFVIRDNVRLITEWNVLFTMLEDHLNSLTSLKQSPYFNNVTEFQEDTSTWESKLTILRGLFDVWVEVQRKWVYLNGIFKNADIKTQLPTQYTKFKGVDSEFLRLMKRVATKPQIQELLTIDGLLGQLERQDSTMTLIQKALGEYLEKQRQIFPRFYFVNNDDLVEIIGNSNEPGKIIPHLSKMFSAINALELVTSDVGGQAKAILSKEGEYVELCQVIDLTVGIKDWLSGLETGVLFTLASLLLDAVTSIPTDNENLLHWIFKYPAQIVILSFQVDWCYQTETALSSAIVTDAMSSVLKVYESRLQLLSKIVLENVDTSIRKKCEQLITEIVHQRDITRLLSSSCIQSKNDFRWQYHLRFYWNPKESDILRKLCIKMANAHFYYGFEYLGIAERLVQTSLTDKCYLTLTQALHLRMGGNPFGPAGTGKTESVKMLGGQLGRFVLVFNCDENFDYAAMGRIFAGLCQVGAFGCFDEFNRLIERILSAVSQQILAIQRGLLAQQETIELNGQQCKLHKDVGIFVTMNPGYAGRSNLPDNLKQLFRAVAMVFPDRKMIAQVMLFSQGIVTAEELASKVVLLFTLCEEQLSNQSHYDFGLRSLKSVLSGAGDLKRLKVNSSKDDEVPMAVIEQEVLIKSTCNNVVPKLVADDIPLFIALLQGVFPNMTIPGDSDPVLLQAIEEVCTEESLECSPSWLDKVLQLKQVIDLRHGVILAGPSSSGKSTAWRVLLKALSRIDNVKSDHFIIDPKSIRKDKLYGVLDPTTLEWTDGVFTRILRRITENDSIKGSNTRRSWIVFDGDVDPEWAENLNSVLDDNKVLTLPSGDRLKLPANVRIIMEVDTLKNATLATVSRCGMIWFAENTLPWDVLFRRQLKLLSVECAGILEMNSVNHSCEAAQIIQNKFIEYLTTHFVKNGLVESALRLSLNSYHIMAPKISRLLVALNSLLAYGIANVVSSAEDNLYSVTESQLEQYVYKWLLYSIVWSFGASMSNGARKRFSEDLLSHSTVNLPNSNNCLIDYFVNVLDGKWVEWSTLVPQMEIESHKVMSSEVVVTTSDTLRHFDIIKAWLLAHKPLILTGPPGSGKTMTLNCVIEQFSQFVLVSLNFSSGTTPELILKTFTQYCEIADSPDGLIMQPNRQSYSEDKWLVVFCDEINLPEQDKYGTQRVIMFMRQLTELGGFWNKDAKWIHLKRIQFVGACNPPTDAGRVPLSERFLRFCPLLFVDHPSEGSLKQIYRCFNHALLKLHPNLKSSVDNLTEAMVQFYKRNKEKFTADVAPQYVYSPRELSRWVRALYEAVSPLEALTTQELVALWAHEGLRLFHDRLISDYDKEWCQHEIDSVAANSFSSFPVHEWLRRPLLYSNWLSKTYQKVSKEDLKNFVAARLKVFYEEELDVPLVLFDDLLEHILRIDNVLRHPMGHLLLVGESGVGKTVMTRFVSWMNGLSVFQIKANSKYTIEHFDEDLRGLLRRAGVEGEKICFIFDESNALSSAFLERMNALLASGEVPGLFEGDDYYHLLNAIQTSGLANRDGVLSTTNDELWRRFTKQVQRNLHVVFTMNPASSDFENRCKTSPALFNRCVVDWYGTWSMNALSQVALEFTNQLDTGYSQFNGVVLETEILRAVKQCNNVSSVDIRECIVAAVVSVHEIVRTLTIKLGKVHGRQHYISPRDFLDLIRKFVSIEQEKSSNLQDIQTHIQKGLEKLFDTQIQVTTLSEEMIRKGQILKGKEADANAKLTQMIDKQNEAEQRKAIAEELAKKLAVQNEEIRIRKEKVENDLSQAEPALLAAKQSVQNIRKNQLDEVRQLARPPTAVQLTVEIVAVMFGEKNLEWSELRKFIRRDDFISSVVNFDPLILQQKQIKKVQEYLSNPELDYNSVDRASKACGPLYMWASSQIHYSTILKTVKPLRDEVESLQEKLTDLETQHLETTKQVTELEESIKQFKVEYAAAIRDMETIRSEMEVVTRKVTRAESLLSSLNEEKDRWQTSSTSFESQMSTLLGDSLLAASFLTYSGIFDHRSRSLLIREWMETLENLGIHYRPDMDVVAYMSTPAQQLLWKSWGLPSDDLALQNGLILEKYYRYPMVVDPSGQAINFFMKKYDGAKISLTSFLDTAFLKTLTSAVRFGTPLIVQDVESLDPVLNPILNKEFQKTGGRTLIRIGSDDVDFSPKFMIVLTTRNPYARFAPDLCSRVTMVNFTVTPASLESQILSKVLHAERPDVDQRRNEVLRLQGEQSAKIRELEEELLNKISAVQGTILNDDSLINALETIKAEAIQLNKEVLNTAGIMNEVKIISAEYEPLANAISTVYFTLEKMSDISFLYQFSLQFFVSVVDKILLDNFVNDNTTNNAKHRINLLSSQFYKEICRRVLRSLCYEDQVMFMVRLAQICTANNRSACLNEAEEDFLYRGVIPVIQINADIQTKWKSAFLDGIHLSDSTLQQLIAISSLQSFAQLTSSMLVSHRKEWKDAFLSESFESQMPENWLDSKISSERKWLLKVLVVRVLRPDRVIAAFDQYINAVFCSSFNWRDLLNFDIHAFVAKDTFNSSPVIICSESGYDASGKIDSLALETNKTLFQVAMGSPQGFNEADRIIAHATKAGCWVLLRNIHLCPEWLSVLEKKLYTLRSHDDFRLFMTCEVNPAIPTSLIRLSEVAYIQGSTGVKSNLQRFATTLNKSKVEKGPIERSRLYYLIAWLNAVVHERLRYVPLGWSKKYEFSETDTSCAVNCIDEWIDSACAGKSHVAPEHIPWDALKLIISQSIFGGRIDNPYDQAILDSFISSIFSADSFGSNVSISTDSISKSSFVNLPDSFGYDALLTWIDSLPDTNSPGWLGLPMTAENQLQQGLGHKVLARINLVQGNMNEYSFSANNSEERTNHLKSLSSIAKNWWDMLPSEICLSSYSSANKSDTRLNSIERCLIREFIAGFHVLREVRSDLSDFIRYCKGEIKPTNENREVIQSLLKGLIPQSWAQLYPTPPDMTIGAWITDLTHRCTALMEYNADMENRKSSTVFWLGGMYAPESFITATRQITAQVYNWSLDDLELYLEIGYSRNDGQHETTLRNLILECASWTEPDGLHLTNDLRSQLPLCILRWKRRNDRPTGNYHSFPVYLDHSRKRLVCEVLVNVPTNIPVEVWVQRGVAFILQFID